jgi:hypothetical protein
MNQVIEAADSVVEAAEGLDEHHDGAVCACGNPSGVILESKPPKCADCRREVSDE